MQDALRTYLELALGVTETSRKRATKVVKKMVGKGGATAEQLQGLANELLEASSANREALVKLVRFEVDRALGSVGLATSDEVAELTTRIRDLERQLREARAQLADLPEVTVTAVAPVPAAEELAAEELAAEKLAAEELAGAEAPPARGAVTAPRGRAAARKAPAGAAGRRGAAEPRAAKKAPAAKKTATKATAAKKAPAAKKTAAKATPAKKAPAKKATAVRKTAAAKKTTSKATAAKKTTAKKTGAKRAPRGGRGQA